MAAASSVCKVVISEKFFCCLKIGRRVVEDLEEAYLLVRILFIHIVATGDRA
jgi:hypothetical protein